MRQSTAELHAQLGQAAATDDHHTRLNAGLNEGATDDDGVHRRTAERFDVDAVGVGQAGHLGHRLRQAAAAALIAVANGLFTAAQQVVHSLWCIARQLQQVPEGQRAAGFGRQVFQQDVGGLRGVALVTRRDVADQVAGAVVQSKIASQAGTLGYVGGRLTSVQPRQVDSAEERVAAQACGGVGSDLGVQVDQVELVGQPQQAEELPFGHDFPELAVALRLEQMVGRPPWPRSIE